MSVIGSDGTVECRCCHRRFPYIAPANANQDGALIHTDCPRAGDSCVTTVPLSDILARVAELSAAAPVTAEVVGTAAPTTAETVSAEAPAEESGQTEAPAEESGQTEAPAEAPMQATVYGGAAEEAPSEALGGPADPGQPTELPLGVTVDPGSDG